MTAALTIASIDASPAVLEGAARYLAAARAPNTHRAYASDVRDFAAWCAGHSTCAVPASPAAVALYLADLAQQGRAPSTIARRRAAIADAHRVAGEPSPTDSGEVRAMLRGIRATHGSAPRRQASPASVMQVRAMLETRGPDLRGVRDRALVLVGFAAARRRSELVALDLDDLVETEHGLEVRVRRAKTDQLGAGFLVGVPFGGRLETCPVRAVRALRAALLDAGVTSGPAFRIVCTDANTHRQYFRAQRLQPRAVSRIVGRAAALAGLPDAHWSGHSLRAGLATAAAHAGVNDRAIMAQTGHASRATLDRYVRGAGIWRENAAAMIGL